MKNKIIKNIGLMVGTSNLAFASATSGKIEDEKLEDKDEFKNNLEVLKNYTNKGVDSTQLVKDIFSKFYKCTKTENKKLKKNILNFSLNFGIKKEDVQDFFKGKIKIDKNKKNVIVLKEGPIFVLLQNTEEQILKDYESLLREKCIILELGNEGVISKLYNTTVDKDKNELSEKIKPYDTKALFETVLNNNAVKDNQYIGIIKLLNNKKLGYGLHDSNSYDINLDGYIIIDVDKTDVNMLSSTKMSDIPAKIRSNISSIKITGNGNILSPADVIIAQKSIKGKKKLLIAKAEDVSKGKIGQQIIDSEFYKSSLENFFNVPFPKGSSGSMANFSIEEEQLLQGVKNELIKNKVDKGIYNYKSFDKNFQNTMNRYIFTSENPITENTFSWQVMEKKEKSIGVCNGSGNRDKFVKEKDKLKNMSVAGNYDITGGKLNDKCIFFIINGDKFMIADFSDIVNGEVNGQKIDDSLYETTTGK